MEKKRTVDIAGVQNVEREITKVLKEEPYSKIKRTDIVEGRLMITFSQDLKNVKDACYVKQVSKKKYSDLATFFAKTPKQAGYLISLQETPKAWIVFFNQY